MKQPENSRACLATNEVVKKFLSGDGLADKKKSCG
jgi:hypothetical protein